MLRRLTLGLIVLVLTGFAASSAFAAQNPVVSDCYSNGRLTHTYPSAELRSALGAMPATVKEYTSCYDIIQAALIKEVGQPGGGGSGSAGSSSGGSFLPTPVIVLLVLVALASVTFGALAIRRHRGGGPAA
jgi:hypothetical protein